MSSGMQSAWSGDIDAARALQDELAARVTLRDGFPHRLRMVAGCRADPAEDGAIVQATAVLVDAETLQPLEQQVARAPAPLPYVPGLFSFRVLPALLQAVGQLSHAPDLLFVDGHGIAHPRRLGLASHLGVATGLPAIGVAERILTGTTSMPLHQVQGAFVPLRDGREQVGWLLRSRVGEAPLAVSPGHRVAMPSVAELVMRFVRGTRLPEPLRLAMPPAPRGP